MSIQPAQIGGKPMRNALAGFFNQTVTILRASLAPDSYGEQIRTWTALLEHEDLAALVAGGDVSVRMKKQEFRTSNTVYEMLYRRVLLSGYYPTIDHGDRARFEGKDWSIISITSDVTSTYTELLCESLEPGNV